MFSRTVIIVALAAHVLVACDQPPDTTVAPLAEPPSAEAAFADPPRVSQAAVAPGGIPLGGTAMAGAEVQLESPAGLSLVVTADDEGRWELQLPGASAPRLFALTESIDGRTIQAQGYVLVEPGGKAAMLRAGGGAIRLDPMIAPAIGAFDFDREGGAVITGLVPAGEPLVLRLDGRQAAEGQADATGHFEIPLSSPVAPGTHRLEVMSDAFTISAVVELSPSTPLQDSPFRTIAVDGGLRVDWMTPGGGVQSTFLSD